MEHSDERSTKRQKMDTNEGLITIDLKWNNSLYQLLVDPDDDVLILKHKIQMETEVLPERQKILNLKGKNNIKIDDNSKISDLLIKQGKPLQMVGSREEDIRSVNEKPEETDEIVNDFEDPEQPDNDSFENRDVYLAKIKRRVDEYKVEVFNPPRPGKKLLVLDIDYTLFDHRSSAETGAELMRPYLHEFLTSAYEHYDIVIWSATSMKWIIEKMKLLRVHTNENFKMTFYLDYNAMISIHHPSKGVVNVKPLKVIWQKFPEFYSSKNTIMFDDIRRNFLMNPKSGLRIKAFSQCHLNRATDTELLKLAKYLKKIAENCDDFNQLNHRKWEGYNP
jgi:ubiquitin-like domain-containing CTD phosphatase 1